MGTCTSSEAQQLRDTKGAEKTAMVLKRLQELEELQKREVEQNRPTIADLAMGFVTDGSLPRFDRIDGLEDSSSVLYLSRGSVESFRKTLGSTYRSTSTEISKVTIHRTRLHTAGAYSSPTPTALSMNVAVEAPSECREGSLSQAEALESRTMWPGSPF